MSYYTFSKVPKIALVIDYLLVIPHVYTASNIPYHFLQPSREEVNMYSLIFLTNNSK